MISLYRPLPEVVWHGEKRYRIRPYFNRIMAVMDLWRDEGMLDTDRLALSLCLLVQGRAPLEPDLLDAICKEVLIPPKQSDDPQIKCFDFLQDAPYIYAGFQQAYGLDLFDMQDRLHWWKFISLFQSLPENTKIMQIISIRARPLPKPTKYNQDEIRQLSKLKKEYALEVSQQERESMLAEQIKRMADMLAGMSNG